MVFREIEAVSSVCALSRTWGVLQGCSRGHSSPAGLSSLGLPPSIPSVKRWAELRLWPQIPLQGSLSLSSAGSWGRAACESSPTASHLSVLVQRGGTGCKVGKAGVFWKLPFVWTAALTTRVWIITATSRHLKNIHGANSKTFKNHAGKQSWKPPSFYLVNNISPVSKFAGSSRPEPGWGASRYWKWVLGRHYRAHQYAAVKWRASEMPRDMGCLLPPSYFILCFSIQKTKSWYLKPYTKKSKRCLWNHRLYFLRVREQGSNLPAHGVAVSCDSTKRAEDTFGPLNILFLTYGGTGEFAVSHLLKYNSLQNIKQMHSALCRHIITLCVHVMRICSTLAVHLVNVWETPRFKASSVSFVL